MTADISHAEVQAEAALAAARKFAKEGNYEKALERHVWFHHNALEIMPSYYGVRLSFALSDWIALGEKYPPALAKLISIRDENTATLTGGKRDRKLFHDVVSINKYLKNSKATVDLFKKIEASDPKFATSVNDIADQSLIDAAEYELARKHMGDPDKLFSRAKRNYENGIEYSKTSSQAAVSRRSFEMLFSNEIIRIITIMEKSGNTKGAQKIQKLALKVHPASAIKNAL